MNRLAERIQQEPQFPHEIGIFLGYPVEDVLGFIENKEKITSSAVTGKYTAMQKKQSVPLKITISAEIFCGNKLNQGYDIYQALKIS